MSPKNESTTVSLFDQVRWSCSEVVRRAGLVKINLADIPEYAASLPLSPAASPEHDPACHFLGRGQDTAAFFVILDTINFGSGFFPHLAKRPGLSGYFTVASSLTDHFRRHGPLSARQLTQLGVQECTAMFGQSPDNAVVRELMVLFAAALNELGRYLLEDFEGGFAALIESAESSAERLAGLLAKMPFFRDVESYGGLDVHFYKRAQLMAADLAVAFKGRGLGRFADLDRLTIFADNLVPHVLRLDGILQYDPGLAARIDREELIPAGSPEEIEIRAAALHAVELIAEELRQKGQSVTSVELDFLLWNRGQQPHYKKSKPRHRSRTVFY